MRIILECNTGWIFSTVLDDECNRTCVRPIADSKSSNCLLPNPNNVCWEQLHSFGHSLCVSVYIWKRDCLVNVWNPHWMNFKNFARGWFHYFNAEAGMTGTWKINENALLSRIIFLFGLIWFIYAFIEFNTFKYLSGQAFAFWFSFGPVKFKIHII